jgi:ribosome-associated translation inhibitor RaiA
MHTAPHVTFRNMEHSDTLASQFLERIGKLDTLFDQILSCHVVIARGGRAHGDADRYHFSINVGLPHYELLVNESPPAAPASEAPQVTAGHAFDEVERQLEDWMGRERDRRYASRNAHTAT